MTRRQLNLLGNFLAAGVLVIAGCGGGGSKADGGNVDVTTTDAGDAGSDVEVEDTGPCTTSFGAGSRLLFDFSRDPSAGWVATAETDPAGWGLADSLLLGGVTTDGDACPGAVTVTLRFTPGVMPDAGGQAQIAMKYNGYYGNTLDWTGYSKLHMSIKVISTSDTALSSIQAYAGLITNTTPPAYPYPHFDTGPFANSAWRRVTIDLSGESAAATKLTELGVRIQLDATAPTPPTIEVRLDDIWLEAAGP